MPPQIRYTHMKRRLFFSEHDVSRFFFYLMQGSTYTCFNHLYLFSIKRRWQRHQNQIISVSHSTYADKNLSKTFCRALYYPLVKPSVIRCCRRESGCADSTCTPTVIIQTATTRLCHLHNTITIAYRSSHWHCLHIVSQMWHREERMSARFSGREKHKQKMESKLNLSHQSH